MKGSIIHEHHHGLLEENMSNLTSASGDQASVSSNQHQSSFASTTPNPNPVKKKRNLPGNPDPGAEVVALSPKSLLATNRFMCEVCNKGFQRDQNLQLHRRGHNLPWKLKHRSGKEVRKKVYICPEVTCVHHDPSRALGDLTGIKKHYCRKHGEKKWKCDKCSKKYAVQSDWKAHTKTCGTREYRCDCGVLFSRRDSFITHRAFCDALAEESARVAVSANPMPIVAQQQQQYPPFLFSSAATTTTTTHSAGGSGSTPFLPSIANAGGIGVQPKQEGSSITSRPPWLTSLHTDFVASSLLSGGVVGQDHSLNTPPPPPYLQQSSAPAPAHMSATALLQRAAQMGTTMEGAPCHPVGFGVALPPEPGGFGHLSSSPPPLMMPPASTSGFNGSFEDYAFGSMFSASKHAILATNEQESSSKGGGGGKDDDRLTRDFLGLTAFPPGDILDMADLNPCMSSNAYKQAREPWHG